METATREGWAQEGGADAAERVLRRYDRETETWDLPRAGELWEAVAAAHRLGRRGRGHTIAVVDGAFDTSIRALARQRLAWESTEGVSTAHGSVVALLILEVAPEAELVLYPTAAGEDWDPERIERALRDAAASGATTIVNLSLGMGFPTADVFRLEEALARAEPWPDMTEEERPFWRGQVLGGMTGWRELLRAPRTPTGGVAQAVAATGTTVLAAAGNRRGEIFSPAVEPALVSVAFFRPLRTIVDGLREDAVSRKPTFSQSEFSDFAVIQPPGVLGTSFATPLMSGFAALMAARRELFAYREMTRLSGLAAELYVRLQHAQGASWDPRRDGVVDALFLAAVRASPHDHLRPEGRVECPECSFFAADAYVNFGLFKLEWGDLDGAEQLLGAAFAFAPDNEHAAANLGMIGAMRAVRAIAGGDLEAARRHLLEAARLQGEAARLRPDHLPYQRRMDEFRVAADDPAGWQMAP